MMFYLTQVAVDIYFCDGDISQVKVKNKTGKEKRNQIIENDLKKIKCHRCYKNVYNKKKCKKIIKIQ